MQNQPHNRSQNWPKKSAKNWPQNWLETGLKLSKILHQIIPKSTLNQPKIGPKLAQNWPKLAQNWPKIGLKTNTKLATNHGQFKSKVVLIVDYNLKKEY
jgi:hypothetical protein